MSVETLNLSQVTAALTTGEYPTQWANNLRVLSSKGLPVTEFASEVERLTDGYVKATISPNGNILGYTVRGTATASSSVIADSNAITLARGTISAPVSTTVSAGQIAVNTSRLAGVGTKVATAASKLALPLTLASIGITLGKTIDETLYNVNPNFWNSIGFTTLNPQTWSSIAGGDGTLGGSFINAIFGIDPNTGESQAYIDSNAMAYLAYCLNDRGVFAQAQSYVSGTVGVTSQFNISDYGTVYCGDSAHAEIYIPDYQRTITFDTEVLSGSPRMCTWLYDDSSHHSRIIAASLEPFKVRYTRTLTNEGQQPSVTVTDQTATSRNIRGVTVYNSDYANLYGSSNTITSGYPVATWSGTIDDLELALAAGTYTQGGGIEGIGDQTGATIPNFSGLSESDYLPYLQQTYPDMFTNAINYPVVQSDGTVKNYTYVPITLPDSANMTNTQPVSGNQTQAQPTINPSTSPVNITDLLTKLLQQPLTQPINDNPTPPENPTDTGDGSSPVPTVPVGSASSLWKIYHPSQSEIDSFGGWLWSSNFIDQILKIFNNPMEAVIGLHKIYATPVDAGTTTIKVGYLDSQVSSSYIEQQYIDISCGSVNLYEQFGNVFDYSPYTDVQLYLPFIGIVPLNVADVMRSTISINYGVDVITGACLAQVTISRDGNSSILYQYSGNCAVQYPISSGSYMGIVSSIISVAGGVAATAASGGAAAPLALGAAGGLLNAHTSVQHSGGFSGNAGAMGGKVPYLIITRPQTKVAFNAETMQGYPTNEYITVGECSGYIKADSVHVINVNATDEELTEINDLLINGIII